jgi:molecular chaperone DnaJ
MSVDYYEVLGVDRGASADQVKKAYRKLARELHPDVNPSAATEDRFKNVTRAYEVLSDPRKREMYDLGGDPAGPQAGGGGAGQAFNFTDIMDAFFGGQGGAAGGGRGPRSRARRGQDALLRVQVDLDDVVHGATRDVTVDTAVVCGTCDGEGTSPGTHLETCDVCKGRGEISQTQRSFLGQVMTTRPCPNCGGFGTVIPRPCPECAGDGRVRARRTLSVGVPAGVDDGVRIQLTEQGEAGPGGGPNGDLYVEISVAPHPVFSRRDDTLMCTLRLPMTAAALGTTIGVDTFDGRREFEVRPGTQPGQQIVLNGLGVPHLQSTGRGNLIIAVDVSVPTKLDDRQEDLLRELARLRDEESPQGEINAPGHHGLFSRLRGAFR